MKNEEPLYVSRGTPANRKTVVIVASLVLAAMGLVCLALPSRADYPSYFIWLGIVLIAAAPILMKFSLSATDASELYIYEDHVEGIQGSLVWGVQQSANKTFHLPYERISDVQKMEADAILILKSSEETYAVMVDDISTAYKLICDKVYGEE